MQRYFLSLDCGDIFCYSSEQKNKLKFMHSLASGYTKKGEPLFL